MFHSLKNASYRYYLHDNLLYCNSIIALAQNKTVHFKKVVQVTLTTPLLGNWNGHLYLQDGYLIRHSVAWFNLWCNYDDLVSNSGHATIFERIEKWNFMFLNKPENENPPFYFNRTINSWLNEQTNIEVKSVYNSNWQPSRISKFI